MICCPLLVWSDHWQAASSYTSYLKVKVREMLMSNSWFGQSEVGRLKAKHQPNSYSGMYVHLLSADSSMRVLIPISYPCSKYENTASLSKSCVLFTHHPPRPPSVTHVWYKDLAFTGSDHKQGGNMSLWLEWESPEWMKYSHLSCPYRKKPPYRLYGWTSFADTHTSPASCQVSRHCSTNKMETWHSCAADQY